MELKFNVDTESITKHIQYGLAIYYNQILMYTMMQKMSPYAVQQPEQMFTSAGTPIYCAIDTVHLNQSFQNFNKFKNSAPGVKETNTKDLSNSIDNFYNNEEIYNQLLAMVNDTFKSFFETRFNQSCKTTD